MTEEEQIERLKTWWGEYGTSIIAGVTIAIVAFSGWTWWKKDGQQRQAQASEAYKAFETIDVKDSESFVVQANEFKQKHKHSTYGTLAALKLAKHYSEQKKWDEAEKELKNITSSLDDAFLAPILQIRLARVLNEQKKYDEALKILDAVDSEEYVALVEQIKGDTYLASGELDKARKAYQLAQEKSEGLGQNSLEQRVNDLNYAQPHHSQNIEAKEPVDEDVDQVSINQGS